MTTFIGIKLPQRLETAPIFQNILSKYGCNIKTRIGLHDVSDTYCAPEGVILLEVLGEDEVIKNMLRELDSIDDIVCKFMSL